LQSKHDRTRYDEPSVSIDIPTFILGRWVFGRRVLGRWVLGRRLVRPATCPTTAPPRSLRSACATAASSTAGAGLAPSQHPPSSKRFAQYRTEDQPEEEETTTTEAKKEKRKEEDEGCLGGDKRVVSLRASTKSTRRTSRPSKFRIELFVLLEGWGLGCQLLASFGSEARQADSSACSELSTVEGVMRARGEEDGWSKMRRR
jgi:hypothetical protein